MLKRVRFFVLAFGLMVLGPNVRAEYDVELSTITDNGEVYISVSETTQDGILTRIILAATERKRIIDLIFASQKRITELRSIVLEAQDKITKINAALEQVE